MIYLKVYRVGDNWLIHVAKHRKAHQSKSLKTRVVHAPGMPRMFSPASRVSHPDMHHDTCVTKPAILRIWQEAHGGALMCHRLVLKWHRAIYWHNHLYMKIHSWRLVLTTVVRFVSRDDVLVLTVVRLAQIYYQCNKRHACLFAFTIKSFMQICFQKQLWHDNFFTQTHVEPMWCLDS